MKYSELLKVQAASAWHVWFDCSEVAFNYTAIAWNWYVEAFFSDRSMQRYEEVGKCLGYLMALAVAGGMIARVVLQDRIDTYIGECLDEEALRADTLAENTGSENKVEKLKPLKTALAVITSTTSASGAIQWARRTLKVNALSFRTLTSFVQSVQQQDQFRYDGAQQGGWPGAEPRQIVNS